MQVVTGESYALVSTEEQLTALIEELETASLIAVDTETEGLAYEDLIVGYCFSTKPGTGYYVPVRHEQWDGIRCEDQLDPRMVADRLRPVLERVPCVGHNVKFDMQALWKEGIDCNFVDDTLLMSKLFFNYRDNGLKTLVKTLLGHEMAGLESLFERKGRQKPKILPATLTPERICRYAAEDANWTLQLRAKFLSMNPNIRKSALYKIEMKLLKVVGEMESTGIPVSMDFLKDNGALCQEYVDRIEKEILTDIRTRLRDPEYTVSFSSTKQLSKLLFQDLRLPILERTKTGAPSTGRETMAELAKLDPICRRIHTYRTMKKLDSTYLTGLQGSVGRDQRIRANFNQIGTETGRFSSSKPNLQNLPRTQDFYLWEPTDIFADVVSFYETANVLKRLGSDWAVWDAGKEKFVDTGILRDRESGKPLLFKGKRYGVDHGVLMEVWTCPTRDFVRATPGHYLVEADYSQIELRIMAGESKEPTLVQAYSSGDDVHRATAAIIFGVEPETVTDNQRQVGKTINFSLLYGAGADNVSKQLEISKDEAQELIDKYFRNLPNIGSWMDKVKAQASKGYMVTKVGRVRHFPDVRSPIQKFRNKAEREAVNFMIQGAAADVMKFALVRLKSLLHKKFGNKVRMISTVHDSVMLEVRDVVPVEQVYAVINEAMTGFNNAPGSFTLDWPDFVVDVKVGTAWASAKEPKGLKASEMPPDTDVDTPFIHVRRVAWERESGLYEKEVGGMLSQLSTDEPRWVVWLQDIEKETLTGFVKAAAPYMKKDAPGKLLFGVSHDHSKYVEIPIGAELVPELETIILSCFPGCVIVKSEPEDLVLQGIDFGL